MGTGTSRRRAGLEAVPWRRLLISAWPWRSAGYLLLNLPLVVAAALALTIPAVPWLVLADSLADGGASIFAIVGLSLLGGGLMAAFGPVVAKPVAGLERRRLRLVDTRPAALGSLPETAPGPVLWLRDRYADPAAWREFGYVCLLLVAAPVLTGAGLFAVLLTGTLIASPFLVLAQQPGGGPVALAFGQAATLGQSVPYATAGAALLPAVPYLLTILAGAQNEVARRMLAGGPSERLRAELVEVSRSRARLADAFEAERHRIEQDLHDGAQQKLVSLTLQLGLARLDLPPGSPAAQSVAVAHEQAKQLMAELRELIHGIQPQVLSDLGLVAAIGELADQSPVTVTVQAKLDDGGRLAAKIENTAYFVVAEALTNVAKHSGASSATVVLRQHLGLLTVEITDDGAGGADPDRGTGLTGLADRVAVAGGRMLLSSPDGGPTVVC
ncbi:MAG TPA: sensor domain-containing protein [Streptosporangiaceae bacterium]